MKYYTYAHYTADTNQLFYVGKGTYRSTRPQPTRAASKKGRNIYWKNVVQKHGGFTYKVLAEWETEQEALDHEILVISCLKDLKIKLCNLTNGGEGLSGRKHTEEFKKKLSERQKGNKYCLGKKLSPERVEALRELHKGKAKSETHRKNLSKARTGLKVPKIWKPVKCLTTGVIYKSVSEAAEITGCDASHIVKCCRGTLNKTKNLEFSYV